MEKKKIAICTGSRAESGLLAPVITELKHKCNLTLLVTGTHLSSSYGSTWRGLDPVVSQIHVPILLDYDADITVNTSMSLCIQGMSCTLANLRPDMLVVLGDRYEILATCIAAYNLRIPICHMQGGDVTKGSLDDGYRDCISRLSSLHLPATQHALTRLCDMLGDPKAYVVGSLACVMPDVEADDTYEHIIIVHPSPENVLSQILHTVDGSKRTLLIGSNADAGGRDICRDMEYLSIAVPGWDYVPSLPRNEFLEYLKGAKELHGNSSCGVFEAPVLKTKTVNYGTRQQGRILPTEDFYTPYYKPNTVEQIVKYILS